VPEKAKAPIIVTKLDRLSRDGPCFSAAGWDPDALRRQDAREASEISDAK
jgi:hypothetical protein